MELLWKQQGFLGFFTGKTGSGQNISLLSWTEQTNFLRGTYFAIHTHAGDIPTASILEMDFPPSGTADISLFVYKSFVAMLSTSSNWTAASEKTVCMTTVTMQSLYTIHVSEQ